MTIDPSADGVLAMVEHVDVDSYGIVHFSRYISLTETSALVYLRRCHATLSDFEQEGLQLRVREVRMTYKAPATLGEILSLHCVLSRIAIASLTFQVDVRRAKANGEVAGLIASGHLNLVVVLKATGQPVPLPKMLLEKLRDDN